MIVLFRHISFQSSSAISAASLMQKWTRLSYLDVPAKCTLENDPLSATLRQFFIAVNGKTIVIKHLPLSIH
jgi:hypothetical protein